MLQCYCHILIVEDPLRYLAKVGDKNLYPDIGFHKLIAVIARKLRIKIHLGAGLQHDKAVPFSRNFFPTLRVLRHSKCLSRFITSVDAGIVSSSLAGRAVCNPWVTCYYE